MSGLNETDMAAVRDAVSALEDVGFTVDGLDDVERVNHGVQFSVTVTGDTRTKKTRDDDVRTWVDDAE